MNTPTFQRSYVRAFTYLGIASFITMVLYSNYLSREYEGEAGIVKEDEEEPVNSGFLVWNPNCQIPDLDVMTGDVVKLLKPVKYKSCSKHDPLTYVDVSDMNPVLFIDNVMVNTYANKKKLTCCYQVVGRDWTVKNDNNFTITKCTNFNSSVTLEKTTEFVITKCYRGTEKKPIYSNGHTIILPKPEVTERLEKFKEKDIEKPLSVLMIGIDSISRLNLYRIMPSTAAYLNAMNWIELKGYNKIDDNTFPNLMAILTGHNLARSQHICNSKTGELEKCDFMWYKYRKYGYVTAYAEDETILSTFNYEKKGFYNSPTDYYYRPFALATEKHLELQKQNGLTYCVGPVSAGERILDYAHQFVDTYKNEPFFGLFWMNSFSHNDLNTASGMDLKMKKWLDKLEYTGVLNSSMVIFLSDHGLRFGKIRETITGWLEERLPFIYIWLPPWFINKYPYIYRNILLNRNRLTNPYDLHMTLQDVMVLSGRLKEPVQSSACSKCSSLFKLASNKRSCNEAAINPHWCTCYGFIKTNKKDNIVSASAASIITEIDRLLSSNSTIRPLCATLHLKQIIDARVSSSKSNLNETHYLLVIETSPGNAKFEATVAYTYLNSHQFQIKGSISRINAYGKQSTCIHDSELKKYCYCLK